MQKFLLILGLVLSSQTKLRADDSKWLLEFKDKSTNELIWDKRWKPQLKKIAPPFLLKDVRDGLGGPPEPVMVDGDRYVSGSACRAHSCPDKAFFWVDTQTGISAVAAGGEDEVTLASFHFEKENIPAELRTAFVRWMKEEKLTSAKVYFRSKKPKRERLSMPENNVKVWSPPATGPSFPCEKAGSDIEKSICADADMMKIDLNHVQYNLIYCH